MEARAPIKEVARELARELLIAMSSLLPDKVISDSVGITFDMDVIPVSIGDGAETYRSDLISISYPGSPDHKMSPLAFRHHHEI
ncbi:hypothetical protein ACOSQ2_000055 [Xanthoceras sorbifolium]|uniref:Uncharacterized protein n=1 Tax=Xanthoceras sorbifolium TaxID=99658 RepID=A0ABQ8IPJ7_9ROSI|nr:hypothetical protein JRO89_XS01G0405300 [Xanthoceras sorbifolium]